MQVSKPFEIQIKVEICNIFDYLLNWREEYYLDNVMQYFKNVFYKKNADKRVISESEIKLPKKDLLRLVPFD